MRVRKSTPPTAVPIAPADLFRGLKALFGTGSGEEVEREFREAFGGRECFFLSSGKVAFCLLLAALKGLRGRRKVIIPAYTCFSVPSAVRKAGLEIVLCDVRSDSLDFDYGQLEAIADEETLCIVPTHLFGIRSDVERVRRIADPKGIFVIEDSAQALRLPDYGGKEARGDAEFFSLGRGKNITCGSGGVLLTGSGEITAAARKQYGGLEAESLASAAKTLGMLALMGVFVNPNLYWLPDGLSFLRIGETIYDEQFQLSKIQNMKYGLMLNWKEKLRSVGEARRRVGEAYKAALALDRSCPVYSNSLPYLRFPVFMKDAGSKTRACAAFRHLGISAMYPSSIGEVKEISDVVSAESCPNSARIAKTLVTLPTHHLVDDALLGKIRSAIGNDLDGSFRGRLVG